MPQTDKKTLSAQLKKGGLSNLYYIFGADVSSVTALTRQIVRLAVGDNEEFALNRLAGKSLDISALRDMIEIMPMMSEYNCILVNDYNCEEHREDETKSLLDALKDIPPQTVVVFNVTGFEVKTKFDRKAGANKITDKNKKLADHAAKYGVLCECAVPTSGELAKAISAKVSARGGAMSIDVARELAEMCLSDTLLIGNEIDKLCAYAQGREITSDMLRELVHRQSSVTIFNLADAVAAFDRRSAFDALNELMQDKDNRGGVLMSITNSFLDLYRVLLAKRAAKGADTVIHDFDYYKRGFAIERLYKFNQRITLERLRACIRILRDTAVTLNSTSIDEKTVLEEAVVKMLMTGTGGSR